MASESSNRSEQLWIPLPTLPRISVVSSSRARLAHRRPISISLPVKAPSSSPQLGGESSDVLNPSQQQFPFARPAEVSQVVPLIASLPASVSISENRLGSVDSARGFLKNCERSDPLAAFSAGGSPLENTEDTSVSSVLDDNTGNDCLDGNTGLVPSSETGSAKLCDVSSIKSQEEPSEGLSSSCAFVVDSVIQKQQGTSVQELLLIESNALIDCGEAGNFIQCYDPLLPCADQAARCEDIASSVQNSTLDVEVAELNNKIGLNSEESEPEEGQLPGEWSGSDDSVEHRSPNCDVNENYSTISLAGEEDFAAPLVAVCTQTQFRSEENSSLPGSLNSGYTALPSRMTETAKKKKKKKHKKGEGSKKRAREKSSQKYKELKSKKLKSIAGEHLGKSLVERLGQSENPDLQNVKRDSAETENQESKNQKSSSSRDVLEEGEISEPTQISNGILFSLVEDEVGLWTTDDIDDQLVAQMEEDGAVKKKRGPETAERMLKRKIAKRKKRAQKERELGIRRPPRNYVSKPVKVLCTHFMKGRCAKGENCTFSHDGVPLTKQEPCKFLMSHSCLKGDDCPYSHDLKAFPCKFFHTRGLCYDGDSCLFSHGPISEEAREKILKRVEKEKKERASNGCGLEIPTPLFSSPLPAEDDPDPLGWGTSNSCPSFDVDLPQGRPGIIELSRDYIGEAGCGDLVENSHHAYSNLETSSYPGVNFAQDISLYDSHLPGKDNRDEKLDYVGEKCSSSQQTTFSTATLDAAETDLTSSREVSALNTAGPLFPFQRGCVFENGVLEHKKSVPSLTQTTESRKLTIENLLGEVLRH
ncbi:protein MpC3H34 [Marchantia polymorpha subsp. ruderalis]|uniref:C3H1-type domain-containing protein n=1 Tax=Marchantia polymorpha TaxID=3197 RepID=A0A2R6W848_MARPO|nr:hypothetical protein MARPO_0131s0021 [Marchantia polymorpha]BBN20403.1 hypothetical protein Mp_8g18820 [Marchantia polymorpha subsp. ruderalis]|eukprot:PTQ30024.1 hypothetical protein MARPO_0131s0021 [Marchantia polymorpha]